MAVVSEGKRDGSQSVKHPKHSQTSSDRVARLDTDHRGNLALGMSLGQGCKNQAIYWDAFLIQLACVQTYTSSRLQMPGGLGTA